MNCLFKEDQAHFTTTYTGSFPSIAVPLYALSSKPSAASFE